MTKKAKNTAPAPQETEKSNGFATGFFLGVVGGTLGTLLFSTEKGRKILDHLKEEFQPQIDTVMETPEVKALVEEFSAAKEEISTTVSEAKKKFPKFSARQSKKS
ncbi:YtxH domain-containing protein [Candidatus Woesebacteria bacterium]|nr:YtxH domain-containing protein [Candidatus Woesebacteria bacterium]MCD8507184.1 YtxH domain-containing protein [Candidatus Woesebacteria bacterium]MCD8526822.1 YtxH domain-containing protein [Candidatus Woesebacteria bacterium]MCD8545922.1 YtxH domain-containing protein [Candidatus Woesebacteria bacterium]